MANTLIPIQTITATGSASSITFTNIPQNYTDLVVKLSIRCQRASVSATALSMRVNGDTTQTYNMKLLLGTGSTGIDNLTYSSRNDLVIGYMQGATGTASTFSSIDVYLPNYTSGVAKSISGDFTVEQNATVATCGITAGNWTGTAAITSLTFFDIGGGSNITQNSTATLYGVSNGVKATGGTLTVAGGYAYHTFTSTGSFLPSQQIKGAEVLVVAGGGGGKADGGGGGGAGGVVLATSQTLNAANTYTIVVGGGGSGAVQNGAAGTSGSNSQLASFTAIGGGLSDTSGGSGGGGSGRSNAAGGVSTQTTFGTNFIGYGNSGGNSRVSGSGATAGGGGGGAGAVGTSALDTAPGAGGIGIITNMDSGASRYYAGGGGGGSDTYSGALGGIGGGGTGGGGSSAGSATANTGGGGGGGSGQSSGSFRNGGSGGSGLVIVRYPLS
jgi:hypothetical protein